MSVWSSWNTENTPLRPLMGKKIDEATTLDLAARPLPPPQSNQPQSSREKSFADFQRLTTTQSSTIALIPPHFRFTLTLTFFPTSSTSTTSRQTNLCQDFSLY